MREPLVQGEEQQMDGTAAVSDAAASAGVSVVTAAAACPAAGAAPPNPVAAAHLTLAAHAYLVTQGNRSCNSSSNCFGSRTSSSSCASNCACSDRRHRSSNSLLCCNKDSGVWGSPGFSRTYLKPSSSENLCDGSRTCRSTNNSSSGAQTSQKSRSGGCHRGACGASNGDRGRCDSSSSDSNSKAPVAVGTLQISPRTRRCYPSRNRRPSPREAAAAAAAATERSLRACSAAGAAAHAGGGTAALPSPVGTALSAACDVAADGCRATDEGGAPVAAPHLPDAAAAAVACEGWFAGSGSASSASGVADGSCRLLSASGDRRMRSSSPSAFARSSCSDFLSATRTDFLQKRWSSQQQLFAAAAGSPARDALHGARWPPPAAHCASDHHQQQCKQQQQQFEQQQQQFKRQVPRQQSWQQEAERQQVKQQLQQGGGRTDEEGASGSSMKAAGSSIGRGWRGGVCPVHCFKGSVYNGPSALCLTLVELQHLTAAAAAGPAAAGPPATGARRRAADAKSRAAEEGAGFDVAAGAAGDVLGLGDDAAAARVCRWRLPKYFSSLSSLQRLRQQPWQPDGQQPLQHEQEQKRQQTPWHAINPWQQQQQEQQQRSGCATISSSHCPFNCLAPPAVPGHTSGAGVCSSSSCCARLPSVRSSVFSAGSSFTGLPAAGSSRLSSASLAAAAAARVTTTTLSSAAAQPSPTTATGTTGGAVELGGALTNFLRDVSPAAAAAPSSLAKVAAAGNRQLDNVSAATGFFSPSLLLHTPGSPSSTHAFAASGTVAAAAGLPVAAAAAAASATPAAAEAAAAAAGLGIAASVKWGSAGGSSCSRNCAEATASPVGRQLSRRCSLASRSRLLQQQDVRGMHVASFDNLFFGEVLNRGFSSTVCRCLWRPPIVLSRLPPSVSYVNPRHLLAPSSRSAPACLTTERATAVAGAPGSAASGARAAGEARGTAAASVAAEKGTGGVPASQAFSHAAGAAAAAGAADAVDARKEAPYLVASSSSAPPWLCTAAADIDPCRCGAENSSSSSLSDKRRDSSTYGSSCNSSGSSCTRTGMKHSSPETQESSRNSSNTATTANSSSSKLWTQARNEQGHRTGGGIAGDGADSSSSSSRSSRRSSSSATKTEGGGTEEEKEKQLVVKVTHKDRLTSAYELLQARHEVLVLQQLQHPNVSSLLLAGEDDHEVFMFFDAAAYGDLHSLTKMRVFDEQIARHICEQVLRALLYIHRRGVIHCDVKPHNLLVFPPAAASSRKRKNEGRKIRLRRFSQPQQPDQQQTSLANVSFVGSSSAAASAPSSSVSSSALDVPSAAVVASLSRSPATAPSPSCDPAAAAAGAVMTAGARCATTPAASPSTNVKTRWGSSAAPQQDDVSSSRQSSSQNSNSRDGRRRRSSTSCSAGGRRGSSTSRTNNERRSGRGVVGKRKACSSIVSSRSSVRERSSSSDRSSLFSLPDGQVDGDAGTSGSSSPDTCGPQQQQQSASPPGAAGAAAAAAAERLRHAVIKLCDFGLAQHFNYGEWIESRELRGSHGYLAPELLLRRAYNEKIDLWALGVVIFTLIGGYEPFYPPSECIRQELEFDERYWCNVSAEAKDFVAGLLSRDPRQRLDTQQALRHPWIRRRKLRRPRSNTVVLLPDGVSPGVSR